MKKIIGVVLILTMTAIITGCNTITKNFGGTTELRLNSNTKLEVVTWKDDSLWCLTRPMREDEKAETYSYKEYSNFGVIEGEVIIIEVKGDTE